MQDNKVINFLQDHYNFSHKTITDLNIFRKELLKANSNHNFISKSTEINIWHRHILDSAQLVKFIDFSKGSLSDLGSGAGFPGMILAIFNKNKDFHVKLYEKSSVKCKFLNNIVKILDLNVHIYSDSFTKHKIDANYITVRAFKKLDEVMRISRETLKKPHKLIVMLGKSAQDEINKASKGLIYKYKLVNSITSSDSKILLVDVQK